MDAAPILARIAELLNRHGLDAVMVGNAAAALQGAPVTTIDVDFFFSKTPSNIRKLKAITDDLQAAIHRPYYRAADLFRVTRDSDALQIDFMPTLAGIRSFEGLRKRAGRIEFNGHPVYVAALADIIKSKKATGRPKDIAVLPVLENALAEAARHAKDEARSSQERE